MARAAVDPSVDAPVRRGPGRPSRTSTDSLVAAAVDLGLDRFTLAGVAAHLGIGESTVYGYVGGRSELRQQAAASVFAQLDLAVDAATWTAYVDEISRRCAALARDHPGLADYVLFGPFEPSTIATFEALVARIREWLPDVSEDVAFLLVSRPLVSTLTHLGDPVLEPASAWLRQALLRGLDELVAEGTVPTGTGASWRTKLRT